MSPSQDSEHQGSKLNLLYLAYINNQDTMQDAVSSSADDIMVDEGLILLLYCPSNGPDLACKEAHAGNRGMYLVYCVLGSLIIGM